jgi:2-polyprenyl-6-methoxyphenol hydroxylase-like FAD-dependent oxidoreductase
VLQQRSRSSIWSDQFDVIIVGARCAGSPLATLLCRAGLRVCLVDRATFPSDTPSTHGIQPCGVKVLDRLGVLDRILERTEPVENGLLAFDDVRIEVARFDRTLGAPMLNVRRLTLDAILLEAAAASGAELRTGTAVTGLIESGGRAVGVETTSGPLRAPLIIGADGARSSVARLVGAAEYQTTPAQRVFTWAYFEGVAAERKLWLGRIADQAFLASPTDAGLFIAAVVVPVARRRELRSDRERHYAEGLARWPELAAQVEGSRRVGPVRMMSGWHGFFRESAGPGWALVGDAGHFKDPTPGQGIADALRQAVAMSTAIESALGGAEDPDRVLREWWSWRDRDAWEMYWFARDMASGRAPRISVAIEERMAADPRLVESLLRVLNHELPPSEMFTPRLALSGFSKAWADGGGHRMSLLGEARDLALEQIRHGTKPPRRRAPR